MKEKKKNKKKMKQEEDEDTAPVLHICEANNRPCSWGKPRRAQKYNGSICLCANNNQAAGYPLWLKGILQKESYS